MLYVVVVVVVVTPRVCGTGDRLHAPGCSMKIWGFFLHNTSIRSGISSMVVSQTMGFFPVC